MNVTNYIAIVSGQSIPIYLPIKYFKPEKIILLVTHQMHQVGETIKKTINSMLGYANVNIEIRNLNDHFNYAGLYEQMIDIADTIDKDLTNSIVNITGGTKPMSIACFEAFNASGATCIYYENNKVQYLNQNENFDDISHINLLPKEYFKLYGFEYLDNQSGYGFGEKGKQVINELISHKVTLENKIGELYGILSNEKNENKLSFNLSNEKQYNRLLPVLQIFSDAEIMSLQGQEFKFINLKAKKFAMGGWLEQYIFNQLKERNINATINVEIKKESKNELDVVFIYKNNLYVIECKSRLNKDSQQDDLYKLNAQRVNWGSFARVIYISFKEITEAVRSRAQDYKIDVIDGYNIAQVSAKINEIINK